MGRDFVPCRTDNLQARSCAPIDELRDQCGPVAFSMSRQSPRRPRDGPLRPATASASTFTITTVSGFDASDLNESRHRANWASMMMSDNGLPKSRWNHPSRAEQNARVLK